MITARLAWFSLKKPFLNLTARARVLQNVRLISGLISAVVLVMLLTGAFTNSNLYVNRLDCAHVDVSTGLFTTLRESVSSNSESLADNYGPGLTASEIDLLSEYTQTKVENCPQYIKSNIFNWCFGNYNVTETEVVAGKTVSKKKFVYEYCTSHDRDYVYDYRGELETIGLNIILAYAYDDSSITTSISNANYVPDPGYLAKLESRKKLSRSISGLLVCAGLADVLVMVLGIAMYANRGFRKDDSASPMLMRHTLGALASLAFVTTAIGIGLMTVMSFSVRAEIKSELGSFGISSHFGKAWFTLAWLVVATQFSNACAWAGPVWCGVPTEIIRMALEDRHEDNVDSAGTPMLPMHQRRYRDNNEVRFQDEVEEIGDGNYLDDNVDEESESKSDPFITKLESKTHYQEGYADSEDEEQSERRTETPSRSKRIKNLIAERIIGAGSRSPVRAAAITTTLKNYKRRRDTRIDEEEYMNSDIFLTEDDRFIMRRENLLLNPEHAANQD